MKPTKKLLAILLGTFIVLGAGIAFADDSATPDDDEVAVEQQDESTEVESEDVDEVGAASEEAPGQQVPTGDAWTEDYARGLDVATIARGGEAPAGYASATTAGTESASASGVHGHTADATTDTTTDASTEG